FVEMKNNSSAMKTPLTTRPKLVSKNLGELTPDTVTTGLPTTTNIVLANSTII
ncbi:unnamed protein product, partial [Rotaria socialis]